MHSLTKKYNLNREPSRRKDSALKAKKHLFMFSYGWMPFLIKSFKAFQISLQARYLSTYSKRDPIKGLASIASSLKTQSCLEFIKSMK